MILSVTCHVNSTKHYNVSRLFLVIFFIFIIENETYWYKFLDSCFIQIIRRNYVGIFYSGSLQNTEAIETDSHC